MPRPPKKTADDKAKGVAAPRVIDVEGFIRVRDSVHQRLLTIQELIKSFSADYYRQTNLLLGEPTTEGVPGIDPLLDLQHAVVALQNAPLLPAEFAPQPAVEEKKERKKRTHDPNAPKRPLTPYFLYMQTARPIIANDLGSEVAKGAVQEEGQRRWASMNPGEKAGWNNAYQYNLRLYQARVHSYKHGNPEAKLMTDEQALKYADEFQLPLPSVGAEPAGDDHDAIAEQLQQATSADAQGEDEEEPAPVKTPKKAAAGRKRKTATPAAETEAPKAAAPASPDKKRRRTSTKVADTEKEEPKKATGRGKKAKN